MNHHADLMRTIIFDFGNVVAFFDHQLTLERLAPHTDMPPEEIWRSVYLGPMEEEFEAGRMSAEQFVAEFTKLCRLRCDAQFIVESVADIFRPNPEICALLPKLKGRYRLLLGSNTNPIHSRHFQKQLAEPLAHFDKLVLSHDVGDRKPRRGFYEYCLRFADCEPGECLFIDDIAANIEGARAAGLHGLVYQPNDDFISRMRSVGIVI